MRQLVRGEPLAFWILRIERSSNGYDNNNGTHETYACRVGLLAPVGGSKHRGSHSRYALAGSD